MRMGFVIAVVGAVVAVVWAVCSSAIDVLP